MAISDTFDSNKVAVVTGASSGIGLVTAKALAAQGFRIIALGRDPGRCAKAEQEILAAATGEGRVDMLRADLSLMSEVEKVAARIGELTDRIDVLVNNAGGTNDGMRITAEGNEACFASNHLAPFLLTERLLPLLRNAASQSAPGETRVIAVSSSAHETSQGLNFDDLQSTGNFVPILAYCNAKLANILFTRSLARRVSGMGIVCHSMHPGAVDTNFWSYGDEGLQEYGRSNTLISAEEAADTVIWLATADEPGQSTGLYWSERKAIPGSENARDDAAAERLWDESTKLVEASLKPA